MASESRIVSARHDQSDRYILRAQNGGEYEYRWVENMTDVSVDERRAFEAFHRWLRTRHTRPSKAVIVWNDVGQPMIEIADGAVSMEIEPMQPDAEATAALDPEEYDQEWSVDAFAFRTR